ncbi:MAG: hypothetical protein ACPG4D_08505, partial [Alphaproteobacteria bacterium]
PWDDHLFVGDGAVGADNVLTYRSDYHDVAGHGGVLQVLPALPVGRVPRQCHLFWSLKTWAEGPPKYRTPPIGNPRFA